nr:MAG TPA: hypothetical protein [Caudoviricetes sp.]
MGRNGPFRGIPAPRFGVRAVAGMRQRHGKGARRPLQAATYDASAI